MSAASTAVFNYPLTTFAQGFMQDRLALYQLAQILMPIVRVDAAAGTFKKFDDRNAFLYTDTTRGLGGTIRRLAFAATDDTYDCTPHGLAITVDDHERERAGVRSAGAGQELLDIGKTKAMLSVKATSYAKRAVDFALSKLTAVTSRGNWSDNGIDPIDQLDEQLENLSTDVGSTENITLILSTTAFRILRGNAKIKSRMGAIKTNMKQSDLTDMLLFPVNIIVAAMPYTATKMGQSTITKTNVLGSTALLLYGQPSPTLYDPSAFKCFSSSDVLVEGVKTYRDEDSSSDVHKIEWSECMKQTSTLSAKYLAIS